MQLRLARTASLPLATLLSLAAGCDAGTAPSGSGLGITVAPLSLPGVTNACYGLTVKNGLGQTVWTHGHVCADDYGDGVGSITYIGTCDADAGAASNTVTLVLEDLYTTSGVLDHDTYQNPCGDPAGGNYDGFGPCTQTVTCEENADVPVTFDITILRDANQGFFDIAVNFEDVFCSAKLDCKDEEGAPIELAFDPQSGERIPTTVVAVACTGGPKSDTHLYFSDLVLTCQGREPIHLSLGGTPGNQYSATSPAPAPLSQVMLFAGAEHLEDPTTHDDLAKLYTTVALGFDLAAGSAKGCSLSLVGTASDGPLDWCMTPPLSTYPVITWDVDLTSDDGKSFVCDQHPLNAEPGVDVFTAYTRIGDPTPFRTFVDNGTPSTCPGGDALQMTRAHCEEVGGTFVPCSSPTAYCCHFPRADFICTP